MKGRRPEPAALQDAKGNPGRRRRASIVAPPASTWDVKAPVKLTGDAARVWAHLAPELERMKFLRPTDAQAFARYCRDVAHYWDVTQRLDEAGDTYVSESVHGRMLRINPHFVIQERLGRRLQEAEDRFGLSPAARQSIMLRLAQQLPSQPNLPNTAPAQPLPENPAGVGSPIGALSRAAGQPLN
jgi:P27 family predicted phage terminase small subunit